MTQAQRDANRLADAYAFIAGRAADGKATTTVDLANGWSDWSVAQLLAKGMIVRLANVAGTHCVQGRYTTVRAARRGEIK